MRHTAAPGGPGRPRTGRQAGPERARSAFTSAGIPRSGRLRVQRPQNAAWWASGAFSGPAIRRSRENGAAGRYGPATGVRSGVAQGSGASSVACPLRGIRRGARPTGRPAAIRLPSLRTLPVQDASASPTRGNSAVTRASLQKPRCDGLGHTAADHDGDHGQNGPDTDGFLHVRISIVASTAMNRTR